MSSSDNFNAQYKKLNKAQLEAVEALSGPVMVVAGPGTGKTQVLAMRIANILNKTDVKADGILCLTFTNSGVAAMRARLEGYLGETGDKVNVFTFHSFGMKVIEEHFEVLGLTQPPKLLDEIDTAGLFDEVLAKNNWEYLSPRGDRARYFTDLRSLISILKREGVTPKQFSALADKEIERIKNDPESLSTRGESKGEIKKEVMSTLEGLARSREAATFYALYEETKLIKNVFDYDDVLTNLVKIVETSSDAAADIRERYLYVLVDEHQDSSRIQNEFLKVVWGDVETPDLFVVGDDRQLIYGFSGASIEYFAQFKKTWTDAKLITLVDNYRSTQIILDASHALLQSVMTKEPLRSVSSENHPIRLIEARSEKEEILAAAVDLKEKIKEGMDVNSAAILVPKNAQVRRALHILHEAGLPVSSLDNLDLFGEKQAREFIRILKIISNHEDSISLSQSLFDGISGIKPLEAHDYVIAQKMREFSLAKALANPSLFGSSVEVWFKKLANWQEEFKNSDVVETIKATGLDLLKNNQGLVSGKDILITILTLAAKEKEKNSGLTLIGFIDILERMKNLGQGIPIIMEETKGVKVLTLHSSKGLEFDSVWVAHMDERNLVSEKRRAFTLPLEIEEKVEEKDVDKVKRKLYVAITRARKYCTLSYALSSKSGREQEVAKVIQDLPDAIIKKEKFEGKEENTLKSSVILEALATKVSSKYTNRVISASLLNNYFECTWKWYFRSLLQLPETSNEHMEFGSKVHAGIDELLKGGKNLNIEDPVVLKIINTWKENRLPQIAARRENEHSISFTDKKFPHLNMYGRLDLIEFLPDGSVRITDFKTGSAKRKSEIIKLDEEGRLSSLARQIAMYAYLLAGSPKWKGVKLAGTRLEFLEAKNGKDSMYDHSITDNETALLLQDIKDYDDGVKGGSWTSRECHYNSYGKNTVCEYCQLAEIFK
jgi:DNA helicase-2/ATP-dependent DNA helicase PcrA